MEQKKSRIGILDGFRTIAIFVVLLFHFFSRFIISYGYKEDLYPYGDDYNYFKYGYLGVEFFFIISGFVIFFTLEYTPNFSTFWKKRLIRLMPSMLIASLIIFTFFKIFDSHYQASVLDFIPSLVFVRPQLLNNMLESLFGIQLNLNYLNGSFWSLWVEVQFYLYISLIYFWNKLRFIKNTIVISVVFCVANLVIHSMGGNNILGLPFASQITDFYTKWFDNGFNLIRYLPFFVIGMIFYVMFKNKNNYLSTVPFLKLSLLFLVGFVLLFSKNNWERFFFILMLILFITFIYFPEKLKILQTNFFRKNGEASYFLYLIHENVGVFLIVAFGNYFLPYGFVVTLLIIISFAYLSILYYKYIDLNINKYLKNWFLKK